MYKILKGTSVCGDIVIAPLFYFEQNFDLPTNKIKDTNKEINLINNALKTAKEELKEIYDKTLKEYGQEKASIFEAHQMMLEDPDFCDTMCNFIKQDKDNVFQAIQKTAAQFAKIFTDMDDPYMQARKADVYDIAQRLISILLARKNTPLTKPSIILAKDLTPSQVMSFNENYILGFALTQGSLTSHASILAKANGITTVINLKETDPSWDGKTAILDARNSVLIIDPDKEQLSQAEKCIEEAKKQKEILEQLKGKESITKDGKKIKLYANISSEEDIAKALKQDAQGIGLFRTEFTYLKSSTYPREEELFNLYKNSLEKMGGKEIIFRTLDIGADKTTPYFNLPKEENPALGLRAIRLCLTRIDLFKTQLRAILRASAYGKALIMFPMIIAVNEVDKALSVLNEVKQELKEKNISFKQDIPIGIMIETPAAAILSKDLAKKVDFFSIGTNDLMQYTCALDRQNQNLSPFSDNHHPALLKLIEYTIKNAHECKKWVGICGELASDLTLTEAFLKWGVDELSLSPSQILYVKQKVRTIDLSKK